MKIVLDPRMNHISVGQKRFDLHESHRENGHLCDLYCESAADLKFSGIGGLKGTALPERVLIETLVKRCGYPDLWGIDLVRAGDHVRFIAGCAYSPKCWHEPVHLNKFVVRLAKSLGDSGEVESVRCSDPDNYEVLNILVTVKFASIDELRTGYRKLTALLQAKHSAVLNQMMDSVHRTVVRRKLQTISSQYQLDRGDTPQAFICHDSKDKQSIAARVAKGLAELGCHVWYDEFSLCVGDPLRESIERGLKTCKKCVLILSPNFLSNRGWTETEFNAAFTREIISSDKVLLPVWAGVTREQVYDYSPGLADRVGIHWTRGTREVVRRLYAAIATMDETRWHSFEPLPSSPPTA